MDRESVADSEGEIALGCAVALETCAAVLSDRPVQGRIEEVSRLFRDICGYELECGGDIEELGRRFDQRFLVATSPWYVPLSENCVRNRTVVNGVVRYGSVEGPFGSHVCGCYDAAGFDWRASIGDGLFAHAAVPDAFAAELQFLAYLKREEALAAFSEDAAREAHAGNLAGEFCNAHLARWADDAAALLAEPGRDLFSETAVLAARVVASSTECL